MNNSESSLIKRVQGDVFGSGKSYIPRANQFRISSIAYCGRKLQFQKIAPDLEKEFSTKTMGIFAVGEAIHRLIQSELSKEVLIAEEKRITYQFFGIELVGHVDLILFTEKGVKLTDIKSSNSRAFSYLDKYGPNNHHITQANTYASILKIPIFSILYVRKDDFSMKEFDFHQSDVDFANILKKVLQIYEGIKDQLIMDRLPKYPDYWECQYTDRETGDQVYCQWFEICGKVNEFSDLENLLEV